MAELEKQLQALRLEKEKLEEVEAERERGTAKGRTFEEAVADAVDAIALAQGDVAEAVGDLKEATGKVGDVVVAIDACNGPARGRIVIEAKDRRLSEPEGARGARPRAWPSGAPTSRCWSCRPRRRCRPRWSRYASTTATSWSSRSTRRRRAAARARLPARARPRADEALGRRRHRRGGGPRRRGAGARGAHRGAQDQAAAHRRQDGHRQGVRLCRGDVSARPGLLQEIDSLVRPAARPRRRRRTTSWSSRAAARRCWSSCAPCRS